MTNEEQIGLLNTIVNVRLAPSKIHGIGVFAIRDIPKLQRLWGNVPPQPFNLPYEEFDKLIPEVRQLLLERWPGIASKQSLLGKGRFLYPDTLLQAYINHSDSPNYDPILDVTLRDIKAGEEILEDYRQIEGWQVAHKWLDTEKSGIINDMAKKKKKPKYK